MVACQAGFWLREGTAPVFRSDYASAIFAKTRFTKVGSR